MSRGNVVKLAAVVLLGAALLIWSGVFQSRAGTSAAHQEPPAEPARDPDPGTFTAAVVAFTYQTNEALADEQFTGKRITVAGRMIRIQRGPAPVKDGQPTYTLDMSTGERTDPLTGKVVYQNDPLLQFRFTAEQRADLAQLKRGQLVTIEAKPEGHATRENEGREMVYFFECKVIKAED
jgi:hypothetical protein